MSDILVQIPNIPGEASETGFQGQIKCDSMRHVVDTPVESTKEMRRGGVSKHGAIELTHSIDLASTLLRLRASDGSSLGTVVISRLISVGEGSKAAETITLSEAKVVRVQVQTPYTPGNAEPHGKLVETFCLGYGAIRWRFQTYNAQGQPANNYEGIWNTGSKTKIWPAA